MAWASTHSFAVGEVLSASNMNLIQANINDLDRRTTQTSAAVLTSQTSTSTSYTALATAGPAVTETVGTVGLLEVTVYTAGSNNTAGSTSFMAFALSGASTVASADAFAIGMYSSSIGFGWRLSATFPVTGLTAGSTTATAQYKVNSGTGTWSDRRLVATPLGS